MESVLVKRHHPSGAQGWGEGCPRAYVTGETLQSVQEFFHRHVKEWEAIENVTELKDWMRNNQEVVDANPAGWCAVELATLDGLAKQQSQSVEGLLGYPELAGPFQYSAVLGTDNLESFHKQVQQFSALGFTDYKVKVSGRVEEDREKIQSLKNLSIPNLRIRLDANNHWTDPQEVVEYLRGLSYPFFGIEEPLAVNAYQGCRHIYQQLGIPIILDESFLRLTQFRDIQGEPDAWIINLRISKMGGILRSLEIREEANQCGIPLIIGAQVGETSILTRAALTVAARCGKELLAQEGAFGTYLLEHDIVQHPLMFGKKGRLSVDTLNPRAGLGLS